ncbi:MAG TPA: hypothetical protein VG028_03980 [Terriglobia bacterium]|nr:hypothetical protein [Terriglobia bacterium]
MDRATQSFFGAFLLLAFVPLAASAGKNPVGRIPDVAAFNRVRSYCIDMTELSRPEAYDVKGFVQVESKPKGLLTKLPWKLEADCTKESPDAIAKVSFRLHNKMGVVIGTPSDGRLPPMDSYALRAYLQVFDGESQKLLYELEAAPLDNPDPQPSTLPDEEPLTLLRRNATYRAFWTMIDDLKLTSRNHKN